MFNKFDFMIIMIFFFIFNFFSKFFFVDCFLGYYSINCFESCCFFSFGKDCQGICKCNFLFCDYVLGCLRYIFNGMLLFDFCIYNVILVRIKGFFKDKLYILDNLEQNIVYLLNFILN